MDMANYALARRLADLGGEVHLVAHRIAPELRDRPNVHPHEVPKPLRSYLLASPLLDHVGRRWARSVAARGGFVVVNGGNCLWGDVNWVHYVHAAFTPSAASRLYRMKTRVAHRRFLHEERRALRRARVVIANSDRTRVDLIDRLGLHEGRVHRVYYGIDADRFRPASEAERSAARASLGWEGDRPVVAFVGALGDRRKGFDSLFEAWKVLSVEPEWDADLVVIGSGAELDAWIARSAAAGLQRRIRFLGFRDDMPLVLAACDALVAPTRYEAFGLGVLEALCCGLPALVSRSAGVAERYSPQLAELLIPDPDNIAGLVDRLALWRRCSERFRAAALESSAELSRHSWDGMADQIVALAGADA
jgi:glycosyltransferase involved in cell wall biosynthesis